MSTQSVGNGIVGTLGQTVKADHTAAHVDDMVVEVDTLRLADVGAAATLSAAVGVYIEVENGATGQKSQYCADGTEGIAEQTPAAEGNGGDYPYNGGRGEGCHADLRIQQMVNQRGIEP